MCGLITQMNRDIGILVGTRPEVIKMAPVYFALKSSGHLKPILISSGQHRQMLDQAFGVFGLKPDIDLNLMQPGQTLPDLTARVTTGVTSALRELNLSALLLQGDTTTVLGSALAAFYEKIPIGHVEAGLRTNNMLSPFPEEMNRRLTSPLARWNFCPTAPPTPWNTNTAAVTKPKTLPRVTTCNWPRKPCALKP